MRLRCGTIKLQQFQSGFMYHWRCDCRPLLNVSTVSLTDDEVCDVLRILRPHERLAVERVRALTAALTQDDGFLMATWGHDTWWSPLVLLDFRMICQIAGSHHLHKFQRACGCLADMPCSLKGQKES